MQLLPRDIKFYDQFLGQSRLLAAAAALLRSAAESGGTAVADAAKRLREMEKEGDALEREVYQHIHATIITPMDPEDIHGIANSLDSVLNSVEAIGYRLNAYCFTQLPERTLALARALEQCVQALDLIFDTLNERGIESQDLLNKQCDRVAQLEDELQTLAREGVTTIFIEQKDSIELLKLKSVYDHFEIAGDRCKSVADLIANVLAKNS